MTLPQADPMARGGVRRYLDTVRPEEYLPSVGEVNLLELSLTGLADLYGSDKGTIKHNYTTIYANIVDQLLAGQSRGVANLKIVEYGVACGASLRMWATYLPKSFVFGIDVREDCAALCSDLPNVKISIGDVTDKSFVASLEQLAPFDIIIDDASHISEDIVSSFKYTWDFLRPKGYYIVEDLKCTYSQAYTDGFRKNFSMAAQNKRETILRFVDWLMRQADLDNQLSEFRYHPELLVIRKK